MHFIHFSIPQAGIIVTKREQSLNSLLSIEFLIGEMKRNVGSSVITTAIACGSGTTKLVRIAN